MKDPFLRSKDLSVPDDQVAGVLDRRLRTIRAFACRGRLLDARREAEDLLRAGDERIEEDEMIEALAEIVTSTMHGDARAVRRDVAYARWCIRVNAKAARANFK